MKKTGYLLLSLLLAFSMAASAASAASDAPTSQGQNSKGKAHKEQNNTEAPEDPDGETAEDTEGISAEGNGEDGEAPADPERKKGLLRALENVKDTPAFEVISNLIVQKYSVDELVNSVETLSDAVSELEEKSGSGDAEGAADTSGQETDTSGGSEYTAGQTSTIGETTDDSEEEDDTAAVEGEDTSEVEEDGETGSTTLQDKKAEVKQKKAELKALADALRAQIKKEKGALKEAAKTLTALASIYDQTGSTDDAVEVQIEAVLEKLDDIEAYKKLSKLYEKLGQLGIKTYVNGEQPTFDVPPIMVEGRALVPFKAIAAALKAEITWNQEEQSVTVTKDGIVIKLVIGSSTALVNGKEVKLDVPASVVRGRTVVPLRFLGEALKAQVIYEPDTQSIIIYDETNSTSGSTAETAATDTDVDADTTNTDTQTEP